MANTGLHTSLNCSKTNFVAETQIDGSVIPDSQVQPLQQKKGKGRKSKITNVDRPVSDNQTNKNEQKKPLNPKSTRCCMCMKWISCSDTEVFGSAIWLRLSCRRLPDSLAELNAKVGALITQSQTTPGD